MRLDIFVFNNFSLKSREYARTLIKNGDVLVNGIPETKAGREVCGNEDITVNDSLRYVGREDLSLNMPLRYSGFPQRDARHLISERQREDLLIVCCKTVPSKYTHAT